VDASEVAPAIKQEVFLADYKKPNFLIESVSLLFQLYEDHTHVVAESKFQRTSVDDKSLHLDGGPYMQMESVAVNGKQLDPSQYILSATGLKVLDTPVQFTLQVVTRLNPFENTRLEGLYHSGGNFCTQCEAEGFRHITYFLDRPDVLAVYHVRIEADKASFPILLSNGNQLAANDLPGGRHYVEWEDPHPKPSYLFALVAGNLACLSDEFITKSGHTVILNIYVAEQNIDKCGYAMGAVKRAMAWDETVFGLEYDLDIYNIVAVSDFNMGAMENKGLNVFNTKYVLASPETATDTDFSNIEGVIGHEYFHNWTGNRVTCRDWFQLSLKEGLTVFRDQEFTSDMASRAVKRLDDVRLLRLLQFSEDGGPFAHPVRPEKYVEINNFYTATVYNKGAEVIRMMYTLIGSEAFHRGMDIYFDRFDGQAVTCEDFVCAMEAASDVDLKQFRLWYSQAGTPEVKVRRRRHGQNVQLVIEQTCPPTPDQTKKESFHMPFLVGWLSNTGEKITPKLLNHDDAWKGDTCSLELRQVQQVFEFENVPEGAVVSLHRQFSAPVKLEHDLTDDELAFLLSHDSDAYTRWESAQVLASRQILGAVAGNRDEQSEETFMHAFTKALADTTTDPALIAEVLTLPSEIDVGQKMQILDPASLHACREALVQKLADNNKALLLDRYQKLHSGAYSLNQEDVARRKLKNTVLGYIAQSEEGMAVVSEQYQNADNMTDRMAALQLITHSDAADRSTILDSFYCDWQENALVIDKWFAVQAQSKRADTPDIVRLLTEHESFNFKNPNRVRSLVACFSMLNQVGFHVSGGAGYRFLADMILRVDSFNPQTAAKLVAPLGRWRRVNAIAAKQMQESLKHVLGDTSISADVRELCTKSLE